MSLLVAELALGAMRGSEYLAGVRHNDDGWLDGVITWYQNLDPGLERNAVNFAIMGLFAAIVYSFITASDSRKRK